MDAIETGTFPKHDSNDDRVNGVDDDEDEEDDTGGEHVCISLFTLDR